MRKLLLLIGLIPSFILGQTITSTPLIVPNVTNGSSTGSGSMTLSTSPTLVTPSVTGLLTITNSEAVRARAASPFYSFYNGAGSTRFGYIQHTGTNLLLVNEQNGSVSMDTNNATHFTLDATGNLNVSGAYTGTAATLTALPATGVGDTFVCVTGAGVLRQGATCAASSEAIKSSIRPIHHGLDYVMRMQPVRWVYNKNARKNQIGHEDWGFTSQKSLALDPVLGVKDENGKPLSINERAYMAVLVRAVQELSYKVQALEVKSIK